MLAYLNLLGDMRQFPFLGIYVIMFFDILKTFLKFVVIFFIFIVAFGLGFHHLMGINAGPFGDEGSSLLKTTVMMIGEMEFDSIFFDREENPLPYPGITFALFSVFLVVMAIIIANLLIGLAVDDIKAVQEQAVLKRLAMQCESVLDVERLVPVFLLRRFFRQIDKIERRPRRWYSVFSDVVSSSSIVKDATAFRNVSVPFLVLPPRYITYDMFGFRTTLRGKTSCTVVRTYSRCYEWPASLCIMLRLERESYT